jgi:hypothetical protein
MTGGLIAVAAGFGVGSIYTLTQRWLDFPTGLTQGARVAGAAVVGATIAVAVHRKLAGRLERQSAAVTLAGALLDANRECMKLIDVNGRMRHVSEHGADWLGFRKSESRTAAHTSFAGRYRGIERLFEDSATPRRAAQNGAIPG